MNISSNIEQPIADAKHQPQQPPYQLELFEDTKPSPISAFNNLAEAQEQQTLGHST